MKLLKTIILGTIIIFCLMFIFGITKTVVVAEENNTEPVIWFEGALNDSVFVNNIVEVETGYIALISVFNTGDSTRRLIKFDIDHNPLWEITNSPIEQFAIDSFGNIFVTGFGTWNSGIGFLAKYNSGGELLWTRSFLDFAIHTPAVGSDVFNITTNSINIVENYIYITGFYSRGTYEITLENGETRFLSRTIAPTTNLHSYIFKFNTDGHVLEVKDIAATNPQNIRVTHLAPLENGYLAVSGFLNAVGLGSTNINGLYSLGGHDAFVMLFNSDLDHIRTRMIHSAGQMQMGNSLQVFGNDIYIYLNTSTAAANSNSLLLLSPAEQAIWDASIPLWNAGEALILRFDFDLETTLIHRERQAAFANRIAKDDDNFTVVYNHSSGYITIVNYDHNFDLISERTLGEVANQTFANGIVSVGYSLMVFGSSNYRFGTKEIIAGTMDGFIFLISSYDYIIGPYELSITKNPFVEGAPFMIGDSMPILQAGVATGNGNFTWQGNPALQFGTRNYAWVFTPANRFLEPIVGYITITTYQPITVRFLNNNTLISEKIVATVIDIKFPANPMPLEGYKFVSWILTVTQGANGQIFTYTARFEPTELEHSYTIVFMDENNEFQRLTDLSNLDGLDKPEIERDGYEFLGWCLSTRVIEDGITTITYRAMWSANATTNIRWLILILVLAVIWIFSVFFLIIRFRQRVKRHYKLANKN
ncbi:MAG: hypothetical protein FWE36_04540 [Erysipelotrichales bacterium]|nr:hypothetical protein [Erysipelotrichales bacterium]